MPIELENVKPEMSKRIMLNHLDLLYNNVIKRNIQEICLLSVFTFTWIVFCSILGIFLWFSAPWLTDLMALTHEGLWSTSLVVT